MKLFNTIAASVAVAMTAGFAQADTNSQLASLQAQVNQLQAQVNSMGSSNGGSIANLVGINSNLSWQMMGNMAGVGKELTLLQARQAGMNTPITVGGYAQGAFVYQHTNNNGQFNNGFAPIFSGVGSGNSSANRLAIPDADLAFTAAIGNWATAYLQAGAEYIGQSNQPSSSNSNDNLSLQYGYLTIGNFAKNPVYGFIGKKDIDFGSFATVDQFAQPLNRQLFSAVGNTVGVGVNAYGFNGAISVMNGGTGVQNLYTANNDNGKNFAVNLNYGMTNSGVTWNVGAGYLNGSQFLTTNGNTNGAWDVNGKLSVAGFDLLAEYTITAKQTDGIAVDSNGNVTPLYGSSAGAAHANAWSVGADYNFPVMGLNSVVSAEYSSAKLNGVSGNDNVKPKQVSLGYRIQPINNVWTGIEYDWNKGMLGSTTAATNLTTNSVLLNVSAAF